MSLASLTASSSNELVKTLERVAGIEPASSAWKAEVLPLNYTREPLPACLATALAQTFRPGALLLRAEPHRDSIYCFAGSREIPAGAICFPAYRQLRLPALPDTVLVEGAGFEPAKAEPSDLQSDPFGHSGTPPKKGLHSLFGPGTCQPLLKQFCTRKSDSWSWREESNPRPADYKSAALPTELRQP